MPLEMLKKVSWQERARMVLAYSIEYNLSVRKLADEFETSIGKVHYDLLLAKALSDKEFNNKWPDFKGITKVSVALKFLKKKNFKSYD